MYLISQINEDYEGTWSNPLMYENDLDKAIMIAKELQDSMVSLKKKYLQVKKDVNFILEKIYPNFHSNDINLTFEEQIRSTDENEKDDYFTKEEKLLNNGIRILTEKEKFLYEINYMDSSCKLIYFTVKKVLLANDVFELKLSKEKFWEDSYSTRNLSEKHKDLFNSYIN